MSAPGLFIVGCLVTLIVAGALGLLIYAAILDGRDAAARKLAQRSPAPTASESILDIARDRGEFSTLASALDRAGLAETLLHGGPYTVFAPSDGAFARLPDGVLDSLLVTPETLAEILSYHVVPGRMTAAEVAARQSAPTVQGEDLQVSNNGAIRVDGARVVTRDIEATNGLIHVIDRVLLPARL
ncbi:MAG: fasciclin domain-containing protein [Mycobacteriaceae bacterium]|nr:fasciclin domain-containing protein [Mycobacteriaceae bacterium]